MKVYGNDVKDVSNDFIKETGIKIVELKTKIIITTNYEADALPFRYPYHALKLIS